MQHTVRYNGKHGNDLPQNKRDNKGAVCPAIIERATVGVVVKHDVLFQ